jgi:hypothetical protein
MLSLQKKIHKNENQLGAKEGRWVLLMSSIFAIAANTTFQVN